MRYRGFVGGGFGLGTPVVSYAPLPMLIEVISLVIIEASAELGRRVGVSRWFTDEKMVMEKERLLGQKPQLIVPWVCSWVYYSH